MHTELLSDGIMSLIEAGAVTNKYKRINRYKNVFNIAAGSQALCEAMHDNPSMECYPAEYVNDPSIIGMNDHVLSVNAMLEVDLSGQVNAEFLHHHQYTAPGRPARLRAWGGYLEGRRQHHRGPCHRGSQPVLAHRAETRRADHRSPAWTRNSS